MITTTDSALDRALKTLKHNLELGPLIREMETKGYVIRIQRGGPGRNSQTETVGSKNYVLFIREKGDAEVAKAKWGITGTTLENSLAHELGHVYADYLQFEKRPDKSPPSGVTQVRWEAILSETHARRWDQRSRPPGVFIPSVSR